MLDEDALEQFMRSRHFPEKTRQVIRHIRSSDPSRRVESSNKSVAGRYPSLKMGVTIQAESHTNELAAVHGWEHDPKVLEFWDQPPQITLRYKTARGRSVGVPHTPDYFLIGEDFVGWVECKMEEDLQGLQEQQPTRYLKDGDKWRCPPGEEYAARYGLEYFLRSSEDTDWFVIRNLNFLADYMLPTCPSPTKREKEVVAAIFSEQPWMRLSDLLKADPTVPADTIYKLITDGDLYFDMYGGLLSEMENARIFRDEVSSEAYRFMLPAAWDSWQAGPLPVSLTPGSSIIWDGKPWRLVNVGESSVHMLSADGGHASLQLQAFEQLIKADLITGTPEDGIVSVSAAVEKRMRSASEGDMAEALERQRILFPLPDDPAPRSCPPRTLREYRRRYREAEETLGCGFIGLLPRISGRGNRLRKVHKDTLALVEEVMEEEYAKPKQQSLHLTYGGFLNKCEERGFPELSEKTFRKEIRRLLTHALQSKRVGAKAAYVMEEFYWSLDIGTPRHGERPFEIAHVDHTEMDVMLVHPITGETIGRPWLTLLIDAFTRFVLAYVISFRRPNSTTCMTVMRECVRRHHRVPKTLVVDGGSEFKSTHFECLLARLVITKKTRPPSKGRFGSVMERMFGVSNEEFIHTLAGNTQATRNPRSCSPTHRPERLAVWTLRTLTERFEQWLAEHYHQRIHSALGTSPSQFLTAMNAHCGERTHVLIPYTEDFVLSCLPATGRNGKVTIDSARGAKTQNSHYWHPNFRDPALNGKKLEARSDPLNRFHIYVFLKGKWTECLSDRAGEFRHHDPDSIRYATEETQAFNDKEPEIRKQKVKSLAKFHRETVAMEEILAAQRSQAIEAQSQPEHEDEEVGSFESAWNPTLDDLNEDVYKDF